MSKIYNILSKVVDIKNVNKEIDADKKFTPFVTECAIHGKYSLNMLGDDGIVRWHAHGCLKCHKQQQANKLINNSNLSKRFLLCDFNNFFTETAEMQNVLNACIAYANDFENNLKKGRCLTLCGAPGTGKNHLSTAIAKHIANNGFSVLFVKSMQYIDEYWQAGLKNRSQWIEDMAKIDLLILDEVDKGIESKNARDAFFRLIDARYDAVKPTILCTNLQTKQDIIDAIGEPAYDRLAQNGGIKLVLQWDSYRHRNTN